MRIGLPLFNIFVTLESFSVQSLTLFNALSQSEISFSNSANPVCPSTLEPPACLAFAQTIILLKLLVVSSSETSLKASVTLIIPSCIALRPTCPHPIIGKRTFLRLRATTRSLICLRWPP